MNAAPARVPSLGWGLVVVFLTACGADLALVAAAGTDVPFQDQWTVDGQWLLPGWSDGSLALTDLLRPHNEHRIIWSHLLNLGLFAANGQWDPLLELVAGGILRGMVTAIVYGVVAANLSMRGRVVAGMIVVAAFLPLPAWHNALWGFQSSAMFALLFGVIALHLLVAEQASAWRRAGGMLAAVAAMLAMGPGLILPAGLAVVWLLRCSERREWGRSGMAGIVSLMLAAWALTATAEAAPAALAATAWSQFARSMGRALAWPHTAQPWAALALNAPLVLAISGRALGRRRGTATEDVVVAVACWAIGIAVAAAWRRGGSDEWIYGVPSRYADFLVLLPLANIWFAMVLGREVTAARRRAAGLAVVAWSVFVAAGWVGLSTEMMRRIILPRSRDREAPARLMQSFLRTGDAAVFAGQPRLLVPDQNLGAVRTVLADPRMRGKLPPSLQPDQPMGPLSRAARNLLGRQ